MKRYGLTQDGGLDWVKPVRDEIDDDFVHRQKVAHSLAGDRCFIRETA